MTKRRDTLQRISRIDSIHTIHTTQQETQEEMQRGRFIGIMTIEAMLDLYMTEISSPIVINFCLLPEQYQKRQENGTPLPPSKQYDKDTADLALAIYDCLDANRGSGFLFYSYDKHGVHSILGEERAGGYGDYMVSGTFSEGY